MTTGRTFSYNLKDGKRKHGYTITLTPADPKTGKYPQVTRKGFSSDRAAKAAMLEHIKTVRSADVGKTTETVGDWLTQWLKESTPTLRPWTVKTYQNVVEYHLLPRLGRIKLSRLSARQIEDMYDELRKSIKEVTIHRIHRTLKTALRAAVKKGILASTPTDQVEPPERRSPRRSTLSVPDAMRLLDWLKEHRPTAYQAAFVAMYTGMREGEVAGLQWRDIDFDRNLIYVERTRQRINDGVDVPGQTKTDGSQRRIIIIDEVVDELKRWQQFQQQSFADWSEKTFVIQLKEDKPPAPAGWATSVRIARIELGLPAVSFHDLRHTHATWLLESGVDLKTVSQRLGHTSITITADTYGHVTDMMQRNAMEKFTNMMENDKK